MDKDYMNIINEDSRFTVNPGEIQLFDENGNSINGNLKKYFEKKKADNITVVEKMKIGDIIKLKETGYIVVVEIVDYKDKNISADYVGSIYKRPDIGWILFGQEDIEKKYSIDIYDVHKMKGR